MKKNTLKHKLSLLIIVIFIPAILIINLMSFIMIQYLNERQVSQIINSTSIMANNIDTYVKSVNTYILNLCALNANLTRMDNANYNIRSYAAIGILSELQSGLIQLNHVDSLFVYSKKYNNLVYVGNSTLSYYENQKIKKYILSLDYTNEIPEKIIWDFISIGGKNFIFYQFHSKSQYSGAFIKVDNLLSYYKNQNLSSNAILMLTDKKMQSKVLTQNISDTFNIKIPSNHYYYSNHKKYLITCSSSKVGNYIFWQLIPRSDIVSSFFLYELLLIIISFIAILSIPFFYSKLNQYVIRPLYNIRKAIEQLLKEDFTYRISFNSPKLSISDEFIEIYETYNRMVDEIGNLKIKIYEETISRQKAELDRLRMHLRPHTYLNAISVVKNYAVMGNIDKMNQYIDYLSGYIRFMLSNSFEQISLNLEISQVNNYLSMQSIRFEHNLFYYIDCPSELYSIQIPPFIIYTFVENSIKHNATYDRMINIFITVKQLNPTETLEVPASGILITIEDNGSGFSEEYIDKINNNLFTAPGEGRQIGIYNIIQILSLVYHDNAKIILSNSETGGAKVDIILRISPKLI
jgi:Putative regulator of cell autolysis